MQNSLLDRFFHYASKAIFIVPLLIIVGGIFIKSSSQKNISTQIVSSITPTIAQINSGKELFGELKKATISAQITLKGPISCITNTSIGKGILFIQNKQVYLELASDKNIQKAILNKDCLYIWTNNSKTGQKKCGLSTYISMFENTTLVQILDNQMIMSNLSKYMNSNSANAEAEITQFIESCKKETILNTSVFNVPGNIVFQEKKM
ncbi:MAG: hypothetical protein Q7R95_05655 [bacterium]|nr:hypothetical protein [bacterium]